MKFEKKWPLWLYEQLEIEIFYLSFFACISITQSVLEIIIINYIKPCSQNFTKANKDSEKFRAKGAKTRGADIILIH